MQPFDRHLTGQQLVLGTPDRAHATAAYALGQAVPSGDQPPRLRLCLNHRAPPVTPCLFDATP
ncbi:hypothetical protein GCM10020000_32370 [Streptomyces olivoverticillatus]